MASERDGSPPHCPLIFVAAGGCRDSEAAKRAAIPGHGSPAEESGDSALVAAHNVRALSTTSLTLDRAAWLYALRLRAPASSRGCARAAETSVAAANARATAAEAAQEQAATEARAEIARIRGEADVATREARELAARAEGAREAALAEVTLAHDDARRAVSGLACVELFTRRSEIRSRTPPAHAPRAPRCRPRRNGPRAP